MIIYKTNQPVTIKYQGRSLHGIVMLASPNGKSLFVEFEGILGGYVGTMPIHFNDNGYEDLVLGKPVELEAR